MRLFHEFLDAFYVRLLVYFLEYCIPLLQAVEDGNLDERELDSRYLNGSLLDKLVGQIASR
jgi:hypothetical protein